MTKIRNRWREQKHDSRPHERARQLTSDRVKASDALKLIPQLKDDHRAIVADFELLRTATKQFENRSISNKRALLDRLALLLKEHFGKEERILFPLLNRSLGSTVCDRMSIEHANMITIVTITDEQSLPTETSLSRLDELLRTHISTEENVLFWYLDVNDKRRD